MSNTAPETSHSNYLFSIFGALASMLLFFAIILIAYVYMQRPAPVDQQTIDNRLAKVADVNAKETALTTEYAWVDQKAGIARVPTELAMQLAVKEIAEKPDGIFPAADSTAAPAPASEDKATAEDEAKADAKDAESEPAKEDAKSADAEAAASGDAKSDQNASGEGTQEAK
ncbi:MAG: hypothetical protein ACQKBW_12645 [Puniceicoccales bacterium]